MSALVSLLRRENLALPTSQTLTHLLSVFPASLETLIKQGSSTLMSAVIERLKIRKKDAGRSMEKK